MTQLTMTGWVDELDRIAQDVTGALLQAGGWVTPPTVHVLCENLPELPYVGSMRSRPFTRGPDAGLAITGLGVFPALLDATRVVVVWEQQDLNIGLNRPGRYPTGLVVLDVPRAGGHVVRWRPMDIIDTGRTTSDGFPIAEPRWHPERAAVVPDGPLPDPISDLVKVWRDSSPQHGGRHVVSTYTTMLDEGYETHWLPRPSGEDPAAGPVWRRVLDPIL